MAKSAKSATQASRTRKRLTPDQKAEIAQSLARGEAGNSIAARLGVSAATVYAQRRKGAQVSDSGGTQVDSALRRRLVSFAVRMLLNQDVSADERSELAREVQDELMKRVAAGI